MKRWSLSSLAITLIVCLLGWAGVACVCLMVGSTAVTWPGAELMRYRREMVLLASLVGAALAMAGVTYQAILRNPLADPYLLGVSSGAALFAYLWRLPALAGIVLAVGFAGQALEQQTFAFVGAMIAVACVLGIGQRRGRLDPVTVLLVGVIVNALAGSIFLLVYSLSSALPSSEGALTMIVGGIQTSLTKSQMTTAAIIIGIGFVVLLAISGQLNTAGMSDAEAEGMGVRIQRLRWAGLVVASIVTAAAVAISGPIGFVGLICPHLARLIVGSDLRKLLPASTAMGAALLALADATSRRLAGGSLVQTLLPVGVLTSLLGGPFFLVLLLQTRRRNASAEGI